MKQPVEFQKFFDHTLLKPDATREEILKLCRDAAQYDFARPFTKESLLYRELFERYYPGQARMVAGFWMPNSTWAGCNVTDPSARVLSNYGDSGK